MPGRNNRGDKPHFGKVPGEIIEEYPEDYPYPSRLILGMTIKYRFLHVAVGIGERKIWLITAYEPDPGQWEDGFKKRKERS